MPATAPLTLADDRFHGASAAGESGQASSFSADGQRIAFVSDAGNLVQNDANGRSDVFVRDVAGGTSTLVSATPDGRAGNGPSYAPLLSADGRYVLFESDASDLVPGDVNNRRDVFRRDLATGTTVLASVARNGGAADQSSSVQALSHDGRRALFLSAATNLTAESSGVGRQLFVRDFQTNSTSLVSVNLGGTAGGNGTSAGVGPAVLSPDGRYAAFESLATDLVPDDLNGIRADVFLRDLDLNTTTLASVNRSGTGGSDHFSQNPVFDSTGQQLAFVSKSSDLTFDPPLGFPQFRVFVRNLTSGVTTLVSDDHAFHGSTPSDSLNPVFSPDGRRVAYEGVISDATTALYLRDLDAGATTLVSVADAVGQPLADGRSTGAAFDPTGDSIYFASTASNLTTGLGGNVRRIYRRDLTAGVTSLVAARTDGSAPTGDSTPPIVSATGATLAFASVDPQLVDDDANSLQDLFFVDLADDGAVRLASTRGANLPPEHTSRTIDTDARRPTGMSDDGRYVVFASDAVDLAPQDVVGRNVYRHDRVLGLTELVNFESDEQGRGGATGDPGISADGRYVIFAGAFGERLIPGLQYEPGAVRAIYVRDMTLGTIQAVNRNAAGRIDSTSSDRYAISPDGRYVAFSTNRPLLASDGNGASDVYVYDRQLQQTTLASVTSGGTAGGAGSFLAASTAVGDGRQVFSDDGRYLLFTSDASNLTPAGGAVAALYRRDLVAGLTSLVGFTAEGAPATTFGHALSGDGNRAVFVTNVRLEPQDTNSQHDVYVRDFTTGVTTRVSADQPLGGTWPTISRDGGKAAYSTTGPQRLVLRDLDAQVTQIVYNGGQLEHLAALSGDGRYVAFLDSQVAPNGLSVHSDLLFYDSATQSLTLASRNQFGDAPGDRGVLQLRPLVSLQGGVVAFASDSTDLSATDVNGRTDVFAFTRPLGGGGLQGVVYADQDADGVFDELESPLAGWRLFIDQNQDGERQSDEPQAVTASDGRFAFIGLAPGDYRIVAELRDAFLPTSPVAATLDATLDADETLAGLNFGFQQQFADLRVESVVAPETAEPGGPLTVEWEVFNDGSIDATGAWQDAVYLSADDRLDPRDTLIGVASRVGGLAVGDSYVGSLTTSTPGLLPGNYRVLVESDRRRQTSQSVRTNDLQASETVALDVPELVVGTDLAGDLSGPGDRRYYRLAPSPNASLEVFLESVATSGAVAVYVRREALPTPGEFDYRGESFGPQATLSIPRTVPGAVYYVLVVGQSGPAAGAGFTLSAREFDLDLRRISPAQGGNSGRVTVRIDGVALTPTATVRLQNGAATFDAETVDYRDPSLLFATFDLTGAPTGLFDLFVFDGDDDALLIDAFEIEPGEQPPLDVRLVTPANFRPGRPTPIVLEVRNLGNTDALAPLLRLRSDETLLSLVGDVGAGRSSMTLLAGGSDGPAGLLRPGQIGRVVLTFTSSPALGEAGAARFIVERPTDDDQTIDWDALRVESRPPFMPADAWDVIWDRYTASAGSTVGGYHKLLADAATYLGRLGAGTPDAGRLIRMALVEAGGILPGDLLLTTTDLWIDAPGLPLGLARAARTSLAGRHRVGPLGYGWTHNWELAIVEDSAGHAAVEHGGGVRFFTRQPNGAYVGAPGDAAELTRTGGLFRLREVDGTVLQFQTDGKLDYLEEPSLNRIEADYDEDGRLIALRHSSGPRIDFTYDGAGRLIGAVDSAGRNVVYAYDDDAHLTSVDSPAGSVEYGYSTDVDPARRHALTTYVDTAGLVAAYDYDELGRLASYSSAGGAESQQLEYGPFGEVVFRDANGSPATAYFNESAQIERLRDALGRETTLDYDARRQLSKTTSADGSSTSFQFDSTGALLRTTSALERTLEFVYETQFSELTRLRDAAGVTTDFDVDDHGRTTAVRYADGSVEQRVYDERGDLTRSILRNGRTIDYTYDARGRLTSFEATDAGVTLYTYDERDNLLSAVDARGAVEMQYDGSDRLLRVDFPDGRFVEYQYDASGRRSGIDQNGLQFAYEYDDAGRLAALLNGDGDDLVRYAYDAVGRLILKQLANGASTTYEYDVAGQLTRLTNRRDDDAINSQFEYAYDDRGRVTSVLTLDGLTTYAYDLDGQLVETVLPAGRTIRYQYDAAGNRVRTVDDAVETNFTADALNQITTAGDAVFTYDANGNLASRTDASGTTIYEFDTLDRLTLIDGPAGRFVYEYDALGNRTAQIRDGVRHEFLFDPTGDGQLIGVFDSDGELVADYFHGLGLVGRLVGADAHFYDFDALGSTRGITDATGDYIAEYAYLPFGETQVLLESAPNPFRYIGEHGVLDRDDGLLDMRFRHFNPTVGQFVSDDPLGLDAGDANLRRYVGNDPVNSADPLGLVDWSDMQRPKKLTSMLHCEGSGRRIPVYVELTVQQMRDELFGGDEFAAEMHEKYLEQLQKWEAEKLQELERLKQAEELQRQKRLQPIKLKIPPRTIVRRTIVAVGGGACHALGGVGLFNDALGAADILWKIALDAATVGVTSSDPNDITGPAGYGPARHTVADAGYSYLIRYQNDPRLASAPAQEVFVTQQLDPDLDWTTFELGDVGFGDLMIDVPPGLKEYQTRVNYRNQDGSPLLVDLHAAVDLASGEATWTFRSVDPETGGLPVGAFDGFLPVDDETGRGSGSIHYLVRPRSDLPTGRTIDAQASIVFDFNAAIVTNQFVNTIDSGAPSARMTPTPAVSNRLFPVSWQGADDLGGSGVAHYSIYVSTDDGPFEPWLEETTQVEALFTGVAGRLYRFQAVAVDHLGWRSTPAPADDAVTRVHDKIWQNARDPLDVDDDTFIAPLDALLIINRLNTVGPGPVPPAAAVDAPPFLDTDGDDFIAPVDALLVINHLNAGTVGAEGEPSAPTLDQTLDQTPDGSTPDGQAAPTPHDARSADLPTLAVLAAPPTDRGRDEAPATSASAASATTGRDEDRPRKTLSEAPRLPTFEPAINEGSTTEAKTAIDRLFARFGDGEFDGEEDLESLDGEPDSIRFALPVGGRPLEFRFRHDRRGSER